MQKVMHAHTRYPNQALGPNVFFIYLTKDENKKKREPAWSSNCITGHFLKSRRGAGMIPELVTQSILIVLYPLCVADGTGRGNRAVAKSKDREMGKSQRVMDQVRLFSWRRERGGKEG